MHLGGVLVWLAVSVCLGGTTPAVRETEVRTGAISPRLREMIAAKPQDTVHVWVFFTDKQLSDERTRRDALSRRMLDLTPRAQRRRALRRISPGLVDDRDLEVPALYVAGVKAVGAKLRHTSRWLNAVSVEANGDQIARVAALSFVRLVQPVAKATRLRPPEGPVEGSPGQRGGAAWYGNSYDQLVQINVTGAHDAGYTGTGIVIGVLDTGFNRTHTAFNQTTGGAHPVVVIDEYDFVDDDPIASQEGGDPSGQADHGTYILGTLGAFHPTVLVGAAYNAEFLLAKTENVPIEVPAEEDDYVAGLEWVEAQGADLATSSLGYIDWYSQSDLDGQTAVTTIAVNIATDNGMPCCTASGNQGNDFDPGTSTHIAPADAFQVLSCGAVDADGFIAFFSSDGPSADGRVKPEVLARGFYTNTVAASDNTSIVGVAGTSLSTPLVAGGVALIVQAHPDWTVDKIRRALFHTAQDFVPNATFDPYYARGYGIIDVGAAIAFVHGDIDGDGLANGGDIQPFVDALLGTNGDFDETRRSDCDANGGVELADAVIFVSDLLGN